MKRIFPVILILILSTLFWAKTPPDKSKSFLWKVQSDKATVYLLGSVHFAKKNIYPLNTTINQAFSQADNLVVEVDIDSVGISKQMKMMSDASYKGNDSVKRHVTKETYQLAKKKLSSYGINIEKLQRFKPWYIALTIMALELKDLGFNPEDGIDRHFLVRAKKRALPILELEGFDYQVNFFNQFDDTLQDLFLYYTLIDLETMNEGMEQIFKSWHTGDVKSFEKLINEAVVQHPKLKPIYKKLFDERNQNMTQTVLAYLQTDKVYFIVVGAGHLVGTSGIINALREKGYKVEQL